MIRCADRLLRRSERVWQLSGFELLFGAQPREGKSGDIDTRYRMTGLLRAMRISIGQSVAEMPAGRIRMALNDQDMRQPKPIRRRDASSSTPERAGPWTAEIPD